MELSAQALGWLRRVERTTRQRAEVGDPLGVAVAAALMARAVPAWTEPFRTVLGQLEHAAVGAADASPASVPAASSRLILAGLHALCAVPDRRRAAAAPAVAAAEADLADVLAAQLGRVEGVDLARAGLALWVHDHRYGTALHRSWFLPRWSVAPVTGGAPRADVLRAARWLAPHLPAEARRLLDAVSLASLPPAELGLALLVARELAITPLDEHLAAHLREIAPPGVDTDGECAWSDDPQAGAALAAAEAVDAGRWAAAASAPVGTEGQIVDVDLARVGLRRARWSKGFLTLGLEPVEEDRQRRTTIRLTGSEPRVWWISGLPDVTAETRGRDVIISLPMLRGTVELAPSSY